MSVTNKNIASALGAAQALAGNDKYEPVNHWFWDQTVSSWEEAGKMGEANIAGREAFEAVQETMNKE
jgi:hypothetical protein